MNEAPPTAAHSYSVARLAVDRHRLFGAKVLLVDDDPCSRALVAEILRRSGAAVATAGSVQEALELLSVETPHAILTDIGMPDEDGYCLLRRVQELEAAGMTQVPCAAMTAYSPDDHAERASAAGFELFLTKPISRVALVEAIATLVTQGPLWEIH